MTGSRCRSSRSAARRWSRTSSRSCAQGDLRAGPAPGRPGARWRRSQPLGIGALKSCARPEYTRPIQVGSARFRSRRSSPAAHPRRCAPAADRGRGRPSARDRGKPTRRTARDAEASGRSPRLEVQTAPRFRNPYCSRTTWSGSPERAFGRGIATRSQRGSARPARRWRPRDRATKGCAPADQRFSRRTGFIGSPLLPVRIRRADDEPDPVVPTGRRGPRSRERPEAALPEVVATLGAGSGCVPWTGQVLERSPSPAGRKGWDRLAGRARSARLHRYSLCRRMLSALGPKVRETTWREEGWQVSSTRGMLQIERDAGSSTSRRRGRSQSRYAEVERGPGAPLAAAPAPHAPGTASPRRGGTPVRSEGC